MENATPHSQVPSLSEEPERAAKKYEEKKKEFEERKKCDDLLVNFRGDDSDGTFSTVPGNAS